MELGGKAMGIGDPPSGFRVNRKVSHPSVRTGADFLLDLLLSIRPVSMISLVRFSLVNQLLVLFHCVGYGLLFNLVHLRHKLNSFR